MAEFLVLILAILLFSAIATLAIYAVGLCLAGCIAYAILIHVIIPLCSRLLVEGEQVARRLYRWYREVTWAYRAMRAHPEAMVPLLNIVVEAQVTLEAFIDVVGRSCLEAVLQLSAAEIAGPPHQGKAGDDIHWHGTQGGRGHAGHAESAGE